MERLKELNQNHGCWLDITTEFKESVKQLNLGELLKTDQFTLLEAMSAIELMDPKMDSGMMLKKSKRQVLTLEQSVRLGLVKINNFELEELAAIMDDTYACMVTWLEGNLLAQTVMTNLYLHNTERIEDRCLRIFSQSILRLVDFMNALVHSVHCIEEEDFQINSGRFDLSTQMSDQKILNSLEDLCQFYERSLSECNNGNSMSQNGNLGHNITDNTEAKSSMINNRNKEKNEKEQHIQSTTIENNHCDEVKEDGVNFSKSQQLIAIINRLRFTHNIYAFFSILHRNFLKEQQSSGPNMLPFVQKTIKLYQSSTNVCDLHLTKCLKYLVGWKETIEFGIKPLDTGDRSPAYEGDYPTIMGFEPLINHKLMPPAYPRCPPMKTRPETVDYFNDLIVKLRECIHLANQSFYQKSFNRSMDSIEKFSKYYRPKSCVISRSFIQVLYLPIRLEKFSPYINFMLKEELSQSMSDYCEPLMQLIKKDEIKSIALDEFLEESAKTFSLAITMYGHNSARQHERFSELITSFKNLQYAAFLLNDLFKNAIIYSWTTYNYAKFCIKYVLAGLELELFSLHEYPYIFWYLYEILYRSEKEQLELAKQLVFDGAKLLLDETLSQTNASTVHNNNINPKNNKNKIKKTRRKQQQYDTSFHDKNILQNDAYRFLTGGMFLLTYGLKVQGKIKSPSMEYTSEQICFDHRFGSITSSAASYKAYKLTLDDRQEKLESIYREAYECFSEARISFERHGELEDCLQLCKANMVVAKILSTNSNSFADREVEFLFDRHPSFPTVKL